MEISVVPSNEMEANQPGNPGSGEGHNQPVETGTELVISIGGSFRGRLRKLMDSDAWGWEKDKRYTFIGQVPMFLREKTELKRYFNPRIVSIGPVHHGKDELEQGEQYKQLMAKLFVGNYLPEEHVESLYNNILNEIASFKECYDRQDLNKFNNNDEELAWIFFVDGCALIEILKYCDELFDLLALYEMYRLDDQIVHLVPDCFLVDNQLPLGVLKLVMEYSGRRESLRMLIHRFADEMIHFEGRAKDEKADSATDESFNEENSLLELIWMKLVKKGKVFDSVNSNTKATPRQFRSVKDLQAAGIILEPNNSSSSLRDISFKQGLLFCKLKIPSFGVREEGMRLVFNLIAFEMHPNFNKDPVVTSYISFLNSLIATKEDVAELRKARILSNFLPNDEDVLKTFRELTSSLKPYPDIFFGTRKQVIKYFNSKKSMTAEKWISDAMHVYFRSPWTTIASISATILLIMTIIQAVFSVLAYVQRK